MIFLATHHGLVFSIGQRVRLKRTRRWAEIIAWPDSLVQELDQLKKSHVAVRTGASLHESIEQRQFWPLKEITTSDHDDPRPIKDYSFRSDESSE